jgi:uncharacterized protein YlxW (UPF0749 family)
MFKIIKKIMNVWYNYFRCTYGGVRMKGAKSKLALAFVCVILGFLLTNKFRALSAKSNNTPESETEKVRIKSEIEAINEANKKLEKANNDLLVSIKKYEDKATKEGNLNETTKNQLYSYRSILGTGEDIKGTGIIFTISPKNNMFSNNRAMLIESNQLVYFINELTLAGAEAIALNDKRITSQTGIRSSSENSYILVNDEKVSPNSKIIIEAIGDKKKLLDAVSNVEGINYPKLPDYDLKYEASNSVTVPKYNKKYHMNYIKPVTSVK